MDEKKTVISAYIKLCFVTSLHALKTVTVSIFETTITITFVIIFMDVVDQLQ